MHPMSFPTEFCLVLQIITVEYLARFVSLIWQISVISGTINEIDVISYDFFSELFVQHNRRRTVQ